MNDSYFRTKAYSDFEKARNKAFFTEIISNLFQMNNSLIQFDEVKYLLTPHGMSYRGMHTIPVSKIIGSEGRYQDFDKNFMPVQKNTRSRWQNIDVAKMKNVYLPPIEVYKIGDYYFVKDGNHRVSVAKEIGQDFIDADVIELYTRVKLDERVFSEKGLLLAEGEKFFLEKTGFDELFPEERIEVTNPWGYYRLIEHINNYRYFYGLEVNRDPEWRETVEAWYRNIYKPMVDLMSERGILDNFPNRTFGDLFIWIMDHWHFLKVKFGEVAMDKAIDDYAKKFGKKKKIPFVKKCLNSLKKIFGKSST